MPEETKLPAVAELAPTCVSAGIEEQKLQQDQRPKESKSKEAPSPDPASVKAAYGWLSAGATVPSTAKLTCLDAGVVQKVADEIDAVKQALKNVAPDVAAEAQPSPVEMIKEP